MLQAHGNGSRGNPSPQKENPRQLTLTREAYEWLVFLKGEWTVQGGRPMSLEQALSHAVTIVGQHQASAVAFTIEENGK